MAAKPSISTRLSALFRRSPSNMEPQVDRSGAARALQFELDYCQTKADGGMLDPAFAKRLAKAFGLKAFIETGTYRGDTLFPLLSSFDALVSVELDDDLHTAALERFKDHPQVDLLKGNSAEMLAKALGLVGDAPALIWLDAHFSGVGTAFGGTNTPVYDELEAIFDAKRPGDVVLIDDLRCFRPLADGFLKHESLDAYPPAEDVAGRLRDHGYTVFVLCDSLVAIPMSLSETVQPSPILSACTRLRLETLSARDREEIETVIRGAKAGERHALVDLPGFIEGSAPYGLGGDYYYWRSLVLAQDDPDRARDDRAFARKTGVAP